MLSVDWWPFDLLGNFTTDAWLTKVKRSVTPLIVHFQSLL